MNRVAKATDLIPEAHCVMGTMLRPFSLGHHLLLGKVGSPFEGFPTADAGADDLSIAVLICAASYGDTQEAILSGDWSGIHRRWIQRLKPKFWQRTRFVHEDELQKFAAYLADGYSRAPVWRHGMSGAATLSAPWELLLTARLGAGGMALDDVLSLYLPAAWYLYHTHAEISQADNCTDIGKWRRVFYTEDDDNRLRAVGRVG